MILRKSDKNLLSPKCFDQPEISAPISTIDGTLEKMARTDVKDMVAGIRDLLVQFKRIFIKKAVPRKSGRELTHKWKDFQSFMSIGFVQKCVHACHS